MREADKRGEKGQAWLIPPTKPEQMASLGTWLLNVPEAHQFWSWYLLAVTHLREEEELPPPVRFYDLAEYEFTILTVDSDEIEPGPEVAEENGLIIVNPPDVVEQFHGISDAAAARIADTSVNAILSGDLSPDSDFRPQWKKKLEETLRSLRMSVN